VVAENVRWSVPRRRCSTCSNMESEPFRCCGECCRRSLGKVTLAGWLVMPNGAHVIE